MATAATSTSARPWRRALTATIAGVATLALLAPSAAADDIIVIPIGDIVRGAEGDVVSIGSVSVPADLVGETCDVRGQTVNQVSVHPGNDLLITTGGQTFVVPDFEDAGFITHEAGVTEALGSTISLQVRLGPDGLSSGGFRVSIDCQPPAPPTTETPPTTEEPTSTAPPTSSPTTEAPPETEPTDSTEVLPTTPTTATDEAEPPAGPTTSPPATEEPTTEAPPTTETPASTESPTTAPPPAGPTADDEVSAGLPTTGTESGLLLAAGLTLVGVGVAARRFARVAPAEGSTD